MKKNIEGFNESLGKGKKTIQKSVYFKRDKLYIQASSNCLETKKKINKPNKCFLHIFLSNLFDVLINSSYNEALKICVILIGISQTFLLQVAVANGTEASSDNIGGNGGAIGVTSGREASVAENVTTVGQARNGVAESVENKAYFDRAVAAVSSAWTNANQKLGPICKLILGEEKGCKDKNLSIPLLLVTIMIVSALIHYVYTQSQNCYNSCCKKSLSEYRDYYYYNHPYYLQHYGAMCEDSMPQQQMLCERNENPHVEYGPVPNQQNDESKKKKKREEEEEEEDQKPKKKKKKRKKKKEKRKIRQRRKRRK